MPLRYAEASLAVYVLLFLISIPLQAAEYRSLGVSRGAVTDMLEQEGLTPSFNKFPSYEGEPVTEATVWKPYINFQMIGPDEGLTEISLTIRPSTDENDAYWHGYVSLWLLAAVFPNWDNREEWLNRAILAGEKVEFTRDGHEIGMYRSNDGGLWWLVISGQEIEESIRLERT